MIKMIRYATFGMIASLLVSTTLKADDSKKINSLENRVSALEQRKSSGGIILPPVYPIVKNGVNLGLSADWLYWKARQDNDCYAVSFSSTVPEENQPFPANKVRGHTPHYNWNSGFRIGADYVLPHDSWDISADWTHIRNTAKNHGGSDDAGIYYLLTDEPTSISNTIPFSSDTSSTQSSKLQVDYIDVELGRAFFTSKWLILRPFAGLRASEINQNFRRTLYLASSTAAELTSICHTKGIGLRGGLNAEWGLGTGFSIYTNGALALVYTQFKPTVKNVGDQVSTNPDATPFILINNFKKEYYESKLNVDLAMGLQWEHLFSQERYGLRLRFGWEQHIFVNQGILPLYLQWSRSSGESGVSSPSTGDLSLQGWTLGARFDF